MQLNNIVLASFLLVANSNADLLSDARAFDKSFSSFSDFGAMVLGSTDFSVQCNFSHKYNLDAPQVDLCEMTNALDKIANKNLAFKIGPCDIAGKNPLSCGSAKIKAYCDAKANKPIKNIVADVRRAGNNILDIGRQKISITGGEQVGKSSSCDTSFSAQTRLPEVYKAQNAITKLSSTPAYGNIINNRFFRMSSECYELMLKSKKSEAEATKNCTPQAIANADTGATNADVEKAIIATAKETLASSMSGMASGAKNDESQLSKWVQDSCGHLKDTKAIRDCTLDVVSKKYHMEEKTQTIVADIESKEAGRSYLFEGATAHRIGMTHPTEDVRSKLPYELQRSYADTAKRSLAQKTIIETFNKRISDTKKELAKLSMQKSELASRIFFTEAESTKIKQELSNAAK